MATNDNMLLDLCGQFFDAWGIQEMVLDTSPEDELAAAVCRRPERLAKLITTIPAKTPAGKRAKARVALLWNASDAWHEASSGAGVARSLAQDLVAECAA